MSFFFSRVLGINISGSKIVIVEVKTEKKDIVIKRLSDCPLPPNTFSDGLILERAALVELLTAVVKDNKLKGVPAVIAVNPRQAVIRPVRMPQIPEKELRKALEFEMGRYSSMSNSPFTMDFIRLGIVEGEGVSQEDLLAIAVKDSVLNELCALVKYSGLQLKAVDLEPNAFIYLRAFAAEQGVWPALEEDWAVVELGAGKTMVAFFQKDILQFVHTIPITFVDEPFVVGDILRELQRSLDYYHLNLKKPQTKDIYVWGIDADRAVPQFRQALPYSFAHLPLSSLAASLTVDHDTLGDEAVLALGMALREVVK